jgi:protein phosphatase
VAPVIQFNQIEYAYLTDVGVRRSHNQDNYAFQVASDDEAWQQRGHLFLVADGMGAHAVGEKASEQAVRAIPHTYHKHSQQGPIVALRKAFVEANSSIHACGQQNREFEGMGTTGTALLLRPEGAWVGHVGDSRVYRIRAGVVEQLSYDHSLVWEYARLKRIDPDQVKDIPHNVIHRCLGPEALVKVDIEGPYPLEEGDTFLLCSDGLSGQVSDSEIGAVATVLPPAEACRFLVDLANLRGGPDNITVLIVRITPGAGGNGKAARLRPPRKPLNWLHLPWWFLTLTVGTLLATLAVYLQANSMRGSLAVFILGAGAIVAGLVGLVRFFYQPEEKPPEPESEQPQPRIHRRSISRIEQPLIDKLVKALDNLKQRAEDKHWEVEWKLVEEARTRAGQLTQAGDLVGTFREYCRAMLPLTRALHKVRNKEEVFAPVWDKST